jgi:hypothetical protein
MFTLATLPGSGYLAGLNDVRTQPACSGQPPAFRAESPFIDVRAIILLSRVSVNSVEGGNNKMVLEFGQASKVLETSEVYPKSGTHPMIIKSLPRGVDSYIIDYGLR